MVIHASTYDDYRILVSRLSSPIVYGSVSDGWWFSWALSGDTAVSIVLEQGEPASFANDFPGRVLLSAPIQIR